ncbi:ALATS [Symbiodinium sp. CCMP2592]|nr:ALATS [Symbiodinium sp. CCMP2592]
MGNGHNFWMLPGRRGCLSNPQSCTVFCMQKSACTSMSRDHFQEPGAVWTASGVILAGGRSSLGYENDVWVWQHSGDFCSVQWQGTWTQLTPQAAWFPRHGHRLVGFVTPGSADVDTVLLVGGFGGEPDSGEVIRGKEPDPADRPNPRNDIWCGNKDLSNWGKWTQIAPTAPFSARAQFAAVIAPTISDFSFVLFGGYDDNARLVVDQWQWPEPLHRDFRASLDGVLHRAMLQARTDASSECLPL